MSKERTRKNRALRNMSDEEILNIVRASCHGLSISEADDKNSRVISLVRKNNLMNTLVQEETLIRKSKVGFYANMTRNKLIEYIRENYLGKSLTELSMEDYGIYNLAHEKGLITYLTRKGILVRKVREKGMFKKASEAELIRHVKHFYGGNFVSVFAERDYTAYQEVLDRGILDKLVYIGILKRKKIKRGLLRDVNYVLEEARRFVEEEGSDNLSYRGLQNKGKSSISMAIGKYHGGFQAFRKVLREYMNQPSERERIEGLLEGYVSQDM